MGVIPCNGFADRVGQWGGVVAEGTLVFAAIDYKWLLKLVHHLDNFVGSRNKQATDTHHHLAHAADLRRLADLLEHHRDELACCHGLRIRHMPDLPKGFVTLAEDG